MSVLAALATSLLASRAAAAPGNSGPRHGEGASSPDSYVLMTGESTTMTNVSLEECERLRARRAGDFLWFRRDGKSYEIDDAATLKQARELFAPLRALEPEQEDLRRRQEALDEKERELDRQQEELERQMDRLTDGTGDDEETESNGDEEFMVSEDSGPATEEERAEIDRELEQLRARQEELRPRQREMDVQNRELDTVERALDAREEKLDSEAEARLWSLIDAAVKNGVARPSQRP